MNNVYNIVTTIILLYLNYGVAASVMMKIISKPLVIRAHERTRFCTVQKGKCRRRRCKQTQVAGWLPYCTTWSSPKHVYLMVLLLGVYMFLIVLHSYQLDGRVVPVTNTHTVQSAQWRTGRGGHVKKQDVAASSHRLPTASVLGI